MNRLTVLTIALAISVALASSTAYTPAYPCTYCHLNMKVNGNVKVSEVHKVDLSKGAHAGLYCSNCHEVDNPMKLKNGEIVIPMNLATREEKMKYNTLCAQCHPRTFSDYQKLVHGNKTMTCDGGQNILILGYKGSPYWFHQCTDYTHFTKKPARACIECHDPHDPVKLPDSIMPPPSDRPEPYKQDLIQTSTLILFVLAAIVSVAAYLRH
ncbi:hypothetical protein EYM_07130 [Ignicoccus islandicus DSM 13165]|uniref:Uncharacterized protein n=1 Tax=Ignicoccus islandicus DSM 13165 TaxID=940295 RepID=A0A0U3G128_9CREN|nr:hypothetical protein [Ignicoccus islandicus]ALU12012.1 hypothetical protein EYM_07130 [Ignicoccus islandicus DSM 13165]